MGATQVHEMYRPCVLRIGCDFEQEDDIGAVKVFRRTRLVVVPNCKVDEDRSGKIPSAQIGLSAHLSIGK